MQSQQPFKSVEATRLTPIALALALCVCSFSARADWPSFRGPFSNGHATAENDTNLVGFPLHWSETNNVVWKRDIPDRGWSTPVVMDGQVWVTTATDDGHDFFAICVDADTGKIRFAKKLFHSDHPEPLGNPMNGYATPSPVIEKGRVYVHFGSYGTACLETKTGKVLWQRDDLPCRHFRGPSSSPLLYHKLLILTFDGIDLEYVTGLDKNTGRTIWKTDRSIAWDDAGERQTAPGDHRKAHSTPILVNAAGRNQMLSDAAKAAYSYDPLTGKEIWRVHFSDYSAAPLPLFENGTVYFVTGTSKTELLAVKPDGKGDVTDSNILWRLRGHVGKFASPIFVDGLIYTAADESFVSCIDAANGQVVWTERLGGRFAASPIYADGHLYFFDQDGVTKVLKPGRTCEVIATNSLAEGFMSSPAISGKAFYLRTMSSLYRIEDGASAVKKD
jgi:outer membrane protein assembly factor BamB